MTEQTKICPFCAETIKAAAIVCRFCNRDLNGMGSKVSPSNSAALRNCPECHGKGEYKTTCNMCSGTHHQECATCRGYGWMSDGYGRETCWNCNGNGKEMCTFCPDSQGFDEFSCEICQGTGQLTHEAFDALMQKKKEAEKAAEIQRQAAEIQRQAMAEQQRAEEAKREEEQRLLLEEYSRRWEEERRQQNKRSDIIKERIRLGYCVVCGQKFGIFQHKSQLPIQIIDWSGTPALFYMHEFIKAEEFGVALAHDHCIQQIGIEADRDKRRFVIRNT